MEFDRRAATATRVVKKNPMPFARDTESEPPFSPKIRALIVYKAAPTKLLAMIPTPPTDATNGHNPLELSARTIALPKKTFIG